MNNKPPVGYTAGAEPQQTKEVHLAPTKPRTSGSNRTKTMLDQTDSDSHLQEEGHDLEAAGNHLAASPVHMESLVRTILSHMLVNSPQAQLAFIGKLAVDEKEAAALLSLNPWQLRDLRVAGKISHHRIVGDRVRYTHDDLRAYLDRGHRSGTGFERHHHRCPRMGSGSRCSPPKIWIFQYKKEVTAKGANFASWYVGWYDHQGKRRAESCGNGSAGRNRADKRQRRLQAELDMGLHRPPSKTLWTEFVEEFARDVLPGLEPATRCAYQDSLKKFEEHTGVKRLETIDTRMVDSFIARRRDDPGKKAGATVTPATIAKDLRLLKAALGRAVDWGYLATLPKFRSVRQPDKIPRYVSDDDFGILYTKACPLARHPDRPGQGYRAEDWWKALIVAAFMTGLRIRELMAMRLEDIDIERGTVITRAHDNKGQRDAMLPLHPIVVDHLRQLGTANDCPLAWPLHQRTLWAEWGRIQKAAGIRLACPARHEHTDACHVYGFHDFRRAFATHNAPHLTPATLQRLMQHRSFKTTLGYINLANQVNQAAERYVVPEVLNAKGKADESSP